MRADVFVFACLGVCLCCVRLCARVCVGRVCVVARPYVFACLRVGVAGFCLLTGWLVSFHGCVWSCGFVSCLQLVVC